MNSLTAVDTQSVRLSVLLYPLGLWVVMAIVAILNGGFREIVLIPRFGDYSGHVLSTGLLVTAILALSFAYFNWIPIEYPFLELLVVGILWTLLTVGFEFLVGYVEGTPVSVTLGQYNLLAGQVWIAVPLTFLLGLYFIHI